MLPYIDIHTHQLALAKDLFQVLNYAVGKEQEPHSPCSAGIHPWYIDEAMDVQFAALNEVASKTNILAIGECGLDKICTTAWTTQLEAFELQIQLAQKINKPLVIHCVRAYAEVLQLLKQYRVDIPVFFHGVHKKQAVIDTLLQHGYYVGLGSFICHGGHDETIRSIALDKIFLETDDKSTDIVAIYSYFCRVRNITIETLQQQLVQNLSDVFNYNIIP